MRWEAALRKGMAFSGVQANSLSWREPLNSGLPVQVSTKTQGAENKCLSDKWDSHLSLIPKVQGPSWKKGAENLQEPEVREDWSEIVSPGHDRTIVLRSSQQLWVPTQEGYMIRPVNMLAWSPMSE